MSLKLIRAALESHLNGMTPALDTAWENVEFTPTPGVPYQRAFFLPAQPEDPEMSSTMRWESGLFQVSLCYPLHKGPGAALERAELIRSRFRRGTTLSSGGVTVRLLWSPEVGSGQYEPDRYVVPVRVRWFSNILT